jgi:hypothetical protein
MPARRPPPGARRLCAISLLPGTVCVLGACERFSSRAAIARTARHRDFLTPSSNT